MPNQGTFILADLSGYTGYLDAAGLQHASKVTAKLLNSLIRANRRRWRVANFEGDCIFFYREGRETPAQLLTHLRHLFGRFFTTVLDMGQDTDCGCGACGGSNQLALKFVVHAGEYAEQRVGGRRELVGPDVVAAHRLLKNQASVREYVLLTNAYVGDDDLDTPIIQRLDSEGLPSYVLDLAPVRRQIEAAHAVFVSARDAAIGLTTRIQAPPTVIWRALLDPDTFGDWSGARESYGFPAAAGAVGTVFRLIMPDGRDFVQLVMAADGENRRVTFRRADIPLTRYVYTTYHVDDAAGGGTHLRCYVAADGPVPLPAALWARSLLKSETAANLVRLKACCEAEDYSR